MLGTGDCVCFRAMFVVLCGGERVYITAMMPLQAKSSLSFLQRTFRRGYEGCPKSFSLETLGCDSPIVR